MEMLPHLLISTPRFRSTAPLNLASFGARRDAAEMAATERPPFFRFKFLKSDAEGILRDGLPKSYKTLPKSLPLLFSSSTKSDHFWTKPQSHPEAQENGERP